MIDVASFVYLHTIHRVQTPDPLSMKRWPTTSHRERSREALHPCATYIIHLEVGDWRHTWTGARVVSVARNQGGQKNYTGQHFQHHLGKRLNYSYGAL